MNIMLKRFNERQKLRLKNRIFDTLHRTGVYTCMAVTVIAGGMCLMGTIDYFFNTRPLRIAEHETKKKLLLQEGISSEFASESNIEEAL